MLHHRRQSATARRSNAAAVGLLVGAIIVTFVHQQLRSSSATVAATAGSAAPPRATTEPDAAAAVPVHPPDAPGASPGSPRDGHGAVPAERRAPLGTADGAVPDGTTVFDDAVPGVALLDPALLGALRRAAHAAEQDGVHLLVQSGWRSAEYQQRLLEDAVAEHGSWEEAVRWVATPATSGHVSGTAIDLGPPDAVGWLLEHGAAYGLCQIYRNEPWHYELRPAAAGHGCPAMYDDPTQDPRMKR